VIPRLFPLSSIWKWRVSLPIVLAGLLAITVISRCRSDAKKEDPAVHQKREANIAMLSETAGQLRAESLELRQINDEKARAAEAQSLTYVDARKKVVLPSDPSVKFGAAPTPGITPEVEAVIAQADTAIPKLTIALAEARAGWKVEQTAGIAELGASKLKDDRQEQRTSWCGRKCGITLGIGGTVATVVVVKQIIKLIQVKKR
jgi:hypothetical protein